jgi:hypothetical protein
VEEMERRMFCEGKMGLREEALKIVKKCFLRDCGWCRD